MQKLVTAQMSINSWVTEFYYRQEHEELQDQNDEFEVTCKWNTDT